MIIECSQNPHYLSSVDPLLKVGLDTMQHRLHNGLSVLLFCENR